jgi:hypothetical protein
MCGVQLKSLKNEMAAEFCLFLYFNLFFCLFSFFLSLIR